MGLTANVVASTPITSAWGNEIRDRTVQRFASFAELTSSWTSPGEGAVAYLTDVNSLHAYNGSAWVAITPRSATVATTVTTSATAYTSLSGGPAVTLQTGPSALVTLTGNLSIPGGANSVFMACAVSGATTLAATDDASLAFALIPGVAAQCSASYLYTGLTPGANTFTARYRAGTASSVGFGLRQITVVGVP